MHQLVEEPEREKERKIEREASFLSHREKRSSARCFFTIHRLYLRAAFARVIRATYKAPLPIVRDGNPAEKLDDKQWA